MTLTREQLTSISENPKAFLNRCYKINERIDAKRERIASWRLRAESTSVTLSHDSGMSGGGYKQSIVANSVVAMLTLEEEIESEIQELLDIEREIGLAINELLTNSVHKVLLEMRYMNHFRMEEIAARLGYAFRYTQELHGRALQHLKESAFYVLSS